LANMGTWGIWVLGKYGYLGDMVMQIAVRWEVGQHSQADRKTDVN